MQLEQDSNDSLGQTKIDQKMKIALFTKSYVIKTFSLFVFFTLVFGTPIEAKAESSIINTIKGFFTGEDALADEIEATSTYNSGVLETSSIDPNTKEVNSASDVNILDGEVIASDFLIGAGLESISNGEMTTYIVQEGDTLSEIAQQFDVSTNTIRWENNITGNNIRVGQKLNILPVTGVKHSIKKGDTLKAIALKYDADAEDIKVFNGIDGDGQLKVGDVIYVPNGIIKAVAPVKKPTSGSKTSSENTTNNSVSSGYYTWPVAGGRITSSYGPRRGGFHYGVDIGAPRGTAVYASASGTVVETVSYCVEGRSSCGGRYGNYIVVEHSNGTLTRYAHLQRVSVAVGERVSKGENIGTVGNTGRSTGPHLHFQIERSNGSTIRPKF